VFGWKLRAWSVALGPHFGLCQGEQVAMVELDRKWVHHNLEWSRLGTGIVVVIPCGASTAIGDVANTLRRL